MVTKCMNPVQIFEHDLFPWYFIRKIIKIHLQSFFLVCSINWLMNSSWFFFKYWPVMAKSDRKLRWKYFLINFHCERRRPKSWLCSFYIVLVSLRSRCEANVAAIAQCIREKNFVQKIFSWKGGGGMGEAADVHGLGDPTAIFE